MLEDYLHRAAATPWRWGAMDCCFFGGGWVEMATGHDPLDCYRGGYDSALGAMRLIRARGGLEAMISTELARFGHARVDVPEHGDLALVAIPEGGQADAWERAAGACLVIRNGPWWVAKAPAGIVGFSGAISPVACWRILP
jgi:hypothetical protein